MRDGLTSDRGNRLLDGVIEVRGDECMKGQFDQLPNSRVGCDIPIEDLYERLKFGLRRQLAHGEKIGGV